MRIVYFNLSGSSLEYSAQRKNEENINDGSGNGGKYEHVGPK